MSKVVVTGATGLIGRRVVKGLLERGDSVIALSRDRAKAAATLPEGTETVEWSDPTGTLPPIEALAGTDAVMHLLGEPISQRWTAAVKRRLRDSRILGTRNLVEALSSLPETERPRTLISQSATGYYGPRGDEPLDEEAVAGSDFLAGVVSGWEAEARAAEPMMRVAMPRTGVVLSPAGGALAVMLPFFRLGIGGPVAGGRQYVPWIHIDDAIAGLLCCLDDGRITGPVNLTAPGAVTNREFSRALGRTLHRPAVLPVPGFALKLLYGEMSQIVTTGQRAVPARLSAAGFTFRQPEIEAALEAAVGKEAASDGDA